MSYARLLAAFILASMPATLLAQDDDVSFLSGGLPATVTNPTSLQFGPDGRLYVAEQDGDIRALTITRNGPANYSVTTVEDIALIKAHTPNHDDDGSACSASCNQRQVTGLLVAGDAATPVLYVTSSDSRISVASDSNLDTNSGVITRLTCSGGVVSGYCQTWDRVDIVRGLPRSEENHSTNGMSLDPSTNTLYVASGGNTNKGAIGNSFAGTAEYFLAAAILSVDLDAIEALETANGGPFTDLRTGQKFIYDLPTLDDPTRPNIDNTHSDFPYEASHPRHGHSIDVADPFGGNNGLNQAIVEPGGPVQVHSPGYRNPYDVLFTSSGDLYTWDNGPNAGWGGTPVVYSAEGVRKGYIGQPGVYDPEAGDYCSNELNEEGSGEEGDNLVLITHSGFYGGHPAPTRAFPAKAGLYSYVQLESGHWEHQGPVYQMDELLPDGLSMEDFPADPRQCSYARLNHALEIVSASTNGLSEYTASAFSGIMKGDILAASFNGNIYRCKPDGAGGLVDLTGSSSGTSFGKCQVLFGGFGSQPLDITAQSDSAIFPGTVWAATYGANSITVFEPQEVPDCDPSDPAQDADADGYSNGDEADNGSNPCSAGSKPSDFDGDFLSDLNDPNDDNDELDDVNDPFALDPKDGMDTLLPLHYSLFNNDPGTGLFGLGFTGLMLPMDGATRWNDLFREEELAAGGAAGLFTVEKTSIGTAIGGSNSQENGFLFAVAADTTTAPFTIRTRLMPPYFEVGGSQGIPQQSQSYGMFIGDGSQSGFVLLGVGLVDSKPGFVVARETGDVATIFTFPSGVLGIEELLSASAIDLAISVDPSTLSAQPRASIDGGADWVDLGPPVALPNEWLSYSDTKGLAVGIISTASTVESPVNRYGATWDFIDIAYDDESALGEWVNIDEGMETRHEGGFVQAGSRFYVVGGRESNHVRIYDPLDGSWSMGAASPIPLHHFQAVEVDGLIYVMGAMTGECCAEPEAEHVYIYDPVADTWTKGPPMPSGRLRGGAGAVAVDGLIYLAGGNVNGHYGEAVGYFDVFDPSTMQFSALPDMPNPRDHFFLSHHQGKIYAVGGRVSDASQPGGLHGNQVEEVDVFDISSGAWSTLPEFSNLPTPRSGAPTGILDNDLIVGGGESGASTQAHSEVEAMNLSTHTWRALAPMLQGRHATQAIVSNGGLYVAAGSDMRGGPSGVNLDVEAFYPSDITAPDTTMLEAGALSGPSTHDFGSHPVGQATQAELVLANSGGNQAILIDSIQISGDEAFFVESPLSAPIVITPGEELALTITFAPASTGTFSATLDITRSGGVKKTVALSGKTGEPAAVADLTISIVDEPDPAEEGSALVYTVTVVNNGPETATGIRAEATVSALLSDPQTIGCQGDPTGVPTCLLGSLAPGESLAWVISADILQGTGGQEAETIVSVSADEMDPDASNNVTHERTVIEVSTPLPEADLAITQTAYPIFSPEGGRVIYTISAFNLGPNPVTGAKVSDLLPAQVTTASWTCSASGGALCIPSGSGSIDEIVDLPLQGKVVFQINAEFFDIDGEPVVNTAMIHVPSGFSDPSPSDNEATTSFRRPVFEDGFESMPP